MTRPKLQELMSSAAYPPLLLGVLAMLAAALLATGDNATRDPISKRRAEDLNASLAQVIPRELHENDLAGDVMTVRIQKAQRNVWRAKKDGTIVAVAFEVVGKGYAGPIKLIMGVGRDGRILGVRVVSHTETPGLGDKIDISRDDWIKSFDGLTIENPSAEKWAVKKDGGQFDQFSGATITPRAVVTAVHEGLAFFKQNSATLTASQPAPHEGGPKQ